MTKTKPAAELIRAGSHWVDLDGFGREWGEAQKEDVYPWFRTEWRGQPVTVTMHAHRYRGSGGALGAWQIVARDAKSGEPNEHGYSSGPNVTDLARHRLGDELRPLVVEWLTTDAYRASERAAYVSAIRRELDDSRAYLSEPTGRTRDKIAKHAAKLGPEGVALLIAACDAFDAYAAAYEATK